MMKTRDERKQRILKGLQGGLIVSCQVQKDDPIYTGDMVVKMAEAAKWAGSVGIRANSPEQIRAIKQAVDLPMIGLWKIWHDDTDVFITPTLEAARGVWEAGAEIIALDCTAQITHEGKPAYELLPLVREAIPEAILFADVSNYEEAGRAIDLGADIVAPTLYGYTEETKNIEEPNLREFARMCRDFTGGIRHDGRTPLYAGGCHEMHLPGCRRRGGGKCHYQTTFDGKEICGFTGEISV